MALLHGFRQLSEENIGTLILSKII